MEAVEAEKGKFDFPYDEIREIFLNPPKYELHPLKWTDPQHDRIMELLCEEHNFGVERIQAGLKRLEDALEELRGPTEQSTLEDFF